MIKQLSLSGFKCFGEKYVFPLAKVTLLYGKNGRGKSSVIQPLLLLAQTMKATDTVAVLNIKGQLQDLGTFDDILTRDASTGIQIEITTGEENLELAFQRFEGKPQLASLSGFVINGENRFDPTVKGRGEGASGVQFAVTTSDVAVLQQLKNAQFITAERLGPQNEVARNDTENNNSLAINGENIINVIHNQSDEFKTRLASELSYVMDGGSLSTQEDNDRILLRLNSVKESDKLYKPVNVGFGYSFVLPVITSALLAEKDSLLIIENPEAHLHPAAQSRLMNFLINQSIERGFQIVIETHSDHVVNGLRLAMKKEHLKPEDAVILFLSYDENGDSRFESILCDHQGELSSYPDDFLDEWTRQMLGLM